MSCEMLCFDAVTVMRLAVMCLSPMSIHVCPSQMGISGHSSFTLSTCVYT